MSRPPNDDPRSCIFICLKVFATEHTVNTSSGSWTAFRTLVGAHLAVAASVLGAKGANEHGTVGAATGLLGTWSGNDRCHATGVHNHNVGWADHASLAGAALHTGILADFAVSVTKQTAEVYTGDSHLVHAEKKFYESPGLKYFLGSMEPGQEFSCHPKVTQ